MSFEVQDLGVSRFLEATLIDLAIVTMLAVLESHLRMEFKIILSNFVYSIHSKISQFEKANFGLKS